MQFTQDSGEEAFVTGLERWFGLIMQDMKVNGNIIKHVVKVNSFILMEIYTTVSGQIIRLMDLVFTLM